MLEPRDRAPGAASPQDFRSGARGKPAAGRDPGSEPSGPGPPHHVARPRRSHRWRPSALSVPTRPGSRGERGRTWSERPGVARGPRGHGPRPIHGLPRPSGASPGHPGLLLPGIPPGANPIQCVSPRPRTHPLSAGAGATGADAALPGSTPRAPDYISHKAAGARRGSESAQPRVRGRAGRFQPEDRGYLQHGCPGLVGWYFAKLGGERDDLTPATRKKPFLVRACRCLTHAEGRRGGEP